MVKIRPFNKLDRAMVRQICCDVADRGEAIESIFSDREVAADLLTSYYTDYEPESTFVVETEGKVVGYINGCLDNRRYGLVILFLIIPKVILKAFVRGVFFRREIWLIFKALLKNWQRVFTWRKKSFHSHQGHVHIGVAKAFRRQQAGEGLVEAFLNYARGSKVDEIAASVHDGNSAACRFFERLGFVVGERHPMMMAYGETFKEYHSISYVKTMV
ncbi:MAG: GNAT family N-acetyltransferase [Candidatus Omnitrophota bacterium]